MTWELFHRKANMSILKNLTRNGISEFKKVLGQKIFKNVKQKTIPISESAIKYSLSKMLSEYDIEIDGLECSGNGILIQAQALKKGIKIKYNLDVIVEQLQITPQEHYTVIAVVSDSLHGENIAGRIASWLIKLMIDDIVAKSVDFTDSQNIVSYDKSNRKATADLIALKHVAMLYEPMTILLGKSVIQFFEVNSVSHTDSGLAIHYNLKTDMFSGMAAGVVEKIIGV